MRAGASVGYLLARTSDTLADTASAPLDMRMDALAQFRQAVAGSAELPRWPVAMHNSLTDGRERKLLECTGDIFRWMAALPVQEKELVREVVEIIVSGQVLDLERFANASAEAPVSLQSDAMLDDYMWRVAGCVGAFWTKLGFVTMGDRFSSGSQELLIEKGIAYGKGLQLVNILRDVGEDLGNGRCYLPVADPRDIQELLPSHARWREQAILWVGEGEMYAQMLQSRRLRAATVLPALLAKKTLEPMRGASWETLATRIKVPRSEVYWLLIRTLLG
jgi:farnesyl-diphosphate farnesyltransferase